MAELAAVSKLAKVANARTQEATRSDRVIDPNRRTSRHDDTARSLIPSAVTTSSPPDGFAGSLDELCLHWRIALNAAEDAIGAAGRGGTSLGFEMSELSTLSRRVSLERSAVSKLLDAAARDERVTLHRPLSAPRASKRMLGLPSTVLACVFELDGVLAGSASVHAAAWAETFNEFLLRRAEQTEERFAPFRPFDPAEYRQHLHGRPRIVGVHAFLASRGIRLREGRPGDPPDAETVYGLGNRKNLALKRRLDADGVSAFADSYRYLEAAHEAGLRCAAVSASTNTAALLDHAGLATLIDERVDGNTIARRRLRPLPAADTLLAACTQLAVAPQNAVLFETTLAGIDAGRTAGFGLVVAVERTGHHQIFAQHGAGLVVTDLGALLDPSLSAPTRVSLKSRSRLKAP